MEPIILFRPDSDNAEEFAVAQKHFAVTNTRLDINRQEMVIGRYSVLPFYRELEQDILRKGAKLVNSYSEHRYVADVLAWAGDLHGMTPDTWARPADAPKDCPLVLKGATNSKKFQWDTHMFAPDFKAAMEIYGRLQDDSLIGTQDIYLRRYVPLRRLDTGPHGLPISEEYRFFVLYGQIVAGGFYWSSYAHLAGAEILPAAVPAAFLEEVVNRVKDRVPFFVVDVARTEDDRWIVVELNDGQMSGLSEVDPNTLYSNMRKLLDARKSNGV